MSPMVDDKKRFELGDYVEVKDRIAILYELFPTARLVTADVTMLEASDGTQRVMVKALAYRTPDDPHPGVGHSWLELPGKTPYTRGSEVENAETSAWGRAIGALGILIDKSIATSNEIATKQDGPSPSSRPAPPRLAPREATSDGGLIGVAEVGKTGTADFELRQTPEGHALSFRLVDGRKGLKVVAVDPLASALAAVKGDVLGKRVTVWGRVTDESFAKDGKTISYQVLHLERIQTPELTLPAPAGLLSPQDEAELEAIAI